ncbi:MAG: hypothetical protein JNM39_18615 [Bdellovibrionaceae bacterium]|nr:hypothetical protein [Pseudobdellovibrionaceae bacterium]
MKLFLGYLFGFTLLLQNFAFAAPSKYSCFTDGYEPGMTIEVTFDSPDLLSDLKTFILMPDGSQEELSYYGSNANTLQKLQDGKLAYTGWDFSKSPATEATIILEKNFNFGIFISRDEKKPVSEIFSITCSKK